MSVINLKQIEKLMQLMQQYDVDKVSVADADGSIKLTRNSGESQGAAPTFSPQRTSSPEGSGAGEVTASSAAAASKSVEQPVAAVKSRTGKEIKSPFVGTYYSASSPGSDPFVYPGKKIKKGEVLCIIEAMKLMNEIEAERDCTIVDILIANEEPVEYDQSLFIVE